MKNEIRNSGIDIIGDVSWGTHFCQFYQTKENLTDILIPYLKAGLENNELCIWIISQPLEVEEAKTVLKKAVPDLDIYLEKGQIEITPCFDWYMEKGIFDSQKALNSLAEKIDQSLASGYDGLRFVEDICWLEKESWNEFANYEKRLDSIKGKHPVIALCTYSLDTYSATDIIDIVANHQFALSKKEGKWEKMENTGKKNITECKQVEQALLESEARYQSLYENSLDGILLTRPDGTILSANPQACYLFGMTEDEIIQAGREGLVVKNEKFEAAFEEKELTGRMNAELTCRRKDGSTFVCNVTSNLFTDTDGIIKTSMIIRDITGSKHAEEAFRKSEERYRMLFTNMTEGFGLVEVIYNDDGKPSDYRYLEINPAFGEYLGVEKEKMLDRTMLEVFPDISPVALEKYHEMAVSGQPVHFEIFSQVADKYLDIYVFSPEKGKLALILRDITERKQMEKELQESEVKYRNIVETASEGIWISDPEARTTYVNKRLAEMIGYAQDEMIGRFAWDFTDEKEKPVVKKNIERRREGIDESYEFKFIRKDSSPLWTIVSSKSLFDSDGKFIGSMSMLTDITRRKEAEAKLKETLENLEEKVRERTMQLEKAYKSLEESKRSLAEAQRMAHLGNWEWDVVTDKVYWSDEIYRILGFNPQEFEVTFNSILNHVYPDDRDYLKNAVEGALNGKPYSIDFRMISADGEERTVHSQGEVTFDEKNNPVRMRGIAQDITERKKAEEALAKMEKIRIKEIHHRIKNNLQVISSLLDLQAETFSKLEVCKTPEVVEAFMESQSRVISMALIHEELYRGSKIDTLDFAAYLRKLTAELFSSYNPGNKYLSFKLDLEQVYLGIDTAIPLGIVVNELVSNAFKHAFPPEREGEIQINLRRAETSAFKNDSSTFKNDISSQTKECIGKEDFHYTLEVSDNGKGISREIDIENSNSLGLQLVNILVEQIDGCIELKRDKGTKFTIWFNDIEV